MAAWALQVRHIAEGAAFTCLSDADQPGRILQGCWGAVEARRQLPVLLGGSLEAGSTPETLLAARGKRVLLRYL